MINFLNSKELSLICAIINIVIAGTCVFDGSWGWALFSGLLAVLCYNNYLEVKQ